MGDVRDIKDAAWAAYCKAPTCRDMGRSKVDAAVDSVLAISARAAVPGGIVSVETGFDYDSDSRTHTPTVVVKMSAVPADGSSGQKPWEQRNALANWLLAAAPQPAGEDEPGCDDCDGYEGEGGHCLMCGKDLSAPHEPATSAPADVEALADEIGTESRKSGGVRLWEFSAVELREFARRLSGAQQAAKDGAA